MTPAALVYFEDLSEGAVYWGDEHVVDQAEMLEYARRNDPWPFHVDEIAARNGPFEGLIASGGYIITLMYRLSSSLLNNPRAAWAFLGGFDWHLRFLAPIRPGDRLRTRLTVKSKRPSRKPGRGVVTILNDLVNHEGALMFSNEAVLLVATRPPGISGD